MTDLSPAGYTGLRGFSASNLWRVKLFYERYSPNEKLAPLVREIGWSHNLVILEKCNDDSVREFYLRMTRQHGWTKNVLIHQIENHTYEKILHGQTNFEQTLPPEIGPQAKLALKDEYTFDFLEMGDEHSERKLEAAIIAALDDVACMPDENPSIGIILCKSKNRTIVEYALRESNKPIGEAGYRVVSELPVDLRDQLPAPEPVARVMEGVGE